MLKKKKLDFKRPKKQPRDGQKQPKEAQDAPKPFPNTAQDPPKIDFCWIFERLLFSSKFALIFLTFFHIIFYSPYP